MAAPKRRAAAAPKVTAPKPAAKGPTTSTTRSVKLAPQRYAKPAGSQYNPAAMPVRRAIKGGGTRTHKAL